MHTACTLHGHAAPGDYTEAIQFQCLERGGVRIFEGINFLSRDATMSDAKMQAIRARVRVRVRVHSTRHKELYIVDCVRSIVVLCV